MLHDSVPSEHGAPDWPFGVGVVWRFGICNRVHEHRDETTHLLGCCALHAEIVQEQAAGSNSCIEDLLGKLSLDMVCMSSLSLARFANVQSAFRTQICFASLLSYAQAHSCFGRVRVARRTMPRLTFGHLVSPASRWSARARLSVCPFALAFALKPQTGTPEMAPNFLLVSL